MKKKQPKPVYTTGLDLPPPSGKSMMLLQLMGWNSYFRTEIDKAKKPGRKRKRTRYRSIDDA